MPSITIRQLDEALKQRLRLRAARNNRSMEDEVRTILRGAAAGEGAGTSTPRVQTSAPAEPAVRPRPGRVEPENGAHRILLIIGGGIAAYKSLDLIRRLKERNATVRCVLTA